MLKEKKKLMKNKKLLTQSEFQIMHILWSLPDQRGYTGDILGKYETPKPAYTTVATFLKILVTKGFVKSRKKNGKVFFTPLISRADYAKEALATTKDYYFDGSFMEMMKFYLKNEEISADDANTLISLIQQQINK